MATNSVSPIRKATGGILTQLTYDSIGIRHNQAMSYIESYAVLDQSLSEFEAAGTLVDYFINLNSTDTITTTWRSYYISLVMKEFDLLDSLNKLGREAVLDYVYPSADVREYTDSILSISDDFTNLGKAQIHDRIHNVRAMAGTDVNLDSSELMQIMAGLVTFEYSLDYWWDFAEIDSKTGEEAESAKLKTAKVVEADAVGAVEGAVVGYGAGGIIGAFAGSIGGPAGTLGGWAGGALVVGRPREL